MKTAFNDLSDSEAERLALLAEECAEVIQIIGKILRHGYESSHPDNPDGDTNRDMLENELGHVHFAEELMIGATDIVKSNIHSSKRQKRKKIGPYLHHND